MSNYKIKKTSYIFFNQRFFQQTFLLGIESVKKFAPKEWLNHSNGIDHSFQNKLKLAKNEAIQQVLEYRKELHKANKLEKWGIKAGIISDPDDSSNSVYSNATDPYYLPIEAELFKVWNKILGTNAIWDFALQRSWFNPDHEYKEFKVFCPCGRSHKKWLEEERLVDFIQKDNKKRQLCRITTFSSGKRLFKHVVKVNGYGSMMHLGLIQYLSILYEEEIKPPKKRKRVSVYHNIQLDITNCYTFYFKG